MKSHTVVGTNKHHNQDTLDPCSYRIEDYYVLMLILFSYCTTRDHLISYLLSHIIWNTILSSVQINITTIELNITMYLCLFYSHTALWEIILFHIYQVPMTVSSYLNYNPISFIGLLQIALGLVEVTILANQLRSYESHRNRWYNKRY